MKIVNMGAFPVIIKMLEISDPGLKLIVLRALYQILECGMIEFKENTYAAIFKSLGGVSKLQNIQQNEDTNIYQIVNHILWLFYGFQYEHMDDSLS